MKTMKILALTTGTIALAATSALAMGCGGDDVHVVATDSGSDATHPSDSGADTNPPVDSGGTDAGTDTGTPLPTGQIDRMGRPAINTALNFHLDPSKDSYNQEATFQDWSANHTYDTNFQNFLVAYDTLGGLAADGGADPVDWKLDDAGVHPLRDPLKLDVLIIDTSADCTTAANNYCVGPLPNAPFAGYLELEALLLLKVPRPATKTCGGRTLAEDVMSKTLTLLITGGRAAISDNVAAATKPPTKTFPYLADPN